jgi:hypothetical protein
VKLFVPGLAFVGHLDVRSLAFAGDLDRDAYGVRKIVGVTGLNCAGREYTDPRGAALPLREGTVGNTIRWICIVAAVVLFFCWAVSIGPAWVEPAGFIAFAASFLPIP